MDGRGRGADGGRDGRERHGGRHGSSLPGSAVKYLGRARYCGGAPRQFIGYREIFYLPQTYETEEGISFGVLL